MAHTSAAALHAVLSGRRGARSRSALLPATLIALLVQACSGGGDGPKEPAVVLTSSSPSNGALGVTRTSQVTLTFSGPLDPASVSASTVSLRCVDTYSVGGYSDAPMFSPPLPAVVAASVSYDAASRTITVAPRLPLSIKRNCVAGTPGVRDTLGRAVASSVSFRTVANPMARTHLYSYGSGTFWAWTSNEYDAAGNVVRFMNYYGDPGPDGEWLTDDDPTRSGWTHAYDDAGNWTSGFASGAPGPDLVWFTNDDVTSSMSAVALDDQGRVKQHLYFDDPGPDGLPFTGDEVASWWKDVVRSAEGDVVAERSYFAPGPDGQWFTADDPVSSYDSFTYDAPGGRLLRFTSVSDPGPDGAWLTADDVPESYYSYGYDAEGRHVTTAIGTGPGPDGIWLTGDDALTACQRGWHDDRNLPVRFAWYWPGADKTCFTSDDELQSHRDFVHADNGSLLTEFSYYGAGPDKIPFTDDDAPSAKTWFDASL